MSYIVWVDHRTDGWVRSEDLADMDEVLGYLINSVYGNDYVVTKTVDVQLMEKPVPFKAGAILSGAPGFVGGTISEIPQ